MFVPRDSPALGAATPPRPPDFDPEIYLTVPIFNRRADLLALTVSFMVFSWTCSALRLYARCIVQRAPGWDDLFMVLALLSTTICSVFLCMAPDFGFGQSMYALTFLEIQDLLKVMYIGNFGYPLSATFIKVALLFQYLRMFKAGSKCSLLCKYLIFVITIWGLAFCLFTWMPCIPLAAYWDFGITNARCWGFGSRQLNEFVSFFVSQAITTSVLDFIVFILPVRLYFKPDTQKKTRVALLCLFVLGLTVNLCSLWRMVNVIQIKMAGETCFDPPWYAPTAAGLANLEAHLAVACAALPVFWPSLEKTWNKIFVTREVSVTTEYGKFPTQSNDAELQSMSSDKILRLDPALMPEGWEPFVGDETTGLGENETVVVSPATAKQPTRLSEFFRRGHHKDT